MNNVAKMKMTQPGLLLRLEGLVVFIGAITIYAHLEWNGLAFILLLLVPDVAMAGYLINPRMGSILYNIAHTYIAPGLLLAGGILMDESLVQQIALIWIAHIGMDRLFGFGLKYPTEFKATHFERI